MKMKQFLKQCEVTMAVLSLVFSGVFLVGCSRSDTAKRRGEPEQIKIAVPVPLTGKYAEYGFDLINAAQMAVDQANNAGGIRGKTIVLITEDDKGDPKDAVTVAYKIAQDETVLGVMGHLNSGTTLAASPVYAEASVPVVMPVPTNPKITQQGFGCLFRIPITDDKQGSAAYEFLATKVGGSGIAIVHNKETYGKGIADEFLKALQGDGHEAKAFEGVNASDQDYRAVIGKIKATASGGIFFGGGYAEAARFIKQAREQGFDGPIVMGDGCFNTDVAKIAGDAVQNCFIANISPINAPDEHAQNFYSEYEAKHGKIVAFAPLGYVATQILIDAIKKSPEFTREAICKILTSPEYSYESILGTFTFKANGDSEGRKIFWHSFENGEFVALGSDE